MKPVLMFATVAVVLATVGCDEPRERDLRGFVAAAGYYSTLEPRVAPVKPGQCPDCRGEGRVGDGTVWRTCQTCGGTGKIVKSVLVKPACENGKCNTPR